ncbi:MAG: sodium:solute symporter [Planctomycetota bacterium]
MNLHLLDAIILLAVLAAVGGTALYARRYTRSVADYLTANRCAGRYLLTVADGMAGLGAVTIVATWEQFYEVGFAGNLWAGIYAPISLILAMSGWIIYRFRQSRAMTLPQFLEMRYSRNFRVFSGVLCFTSGVLNYGIFPAVTGRFLIYFLELPVYTTALGGLELNWTLGVVMAVVLAAALTITLNGGQIAVMVSDFFQGQLASVCFLILLVVILWLIPWSTMTETLRSAPAGESKLNPFEQSGLDGFNPWFFVMMAVLQIYMYRVWQGTQAYNASARDPHEAKMANVLSQFRGLIQVLLVPLAAVAAWVLLNGDVLPEQAAAVQGQLDALEADGREQVAKQLTTTLAMKEILPVGVFGLLVAVMVMAAISTDSTYLHSWGAIFAQDVVSPIRENMGQAHLSPQRHLTLLRWSSVGVAVFAWCFSMIFPLQEYIFMYFQLTGAIFTGGAGAVLIGGLYWRRGATAGAWLAMGIGSALSVIGVLLINVVWPAAVPALQQAYPAVGWVRALPDEFYLDGVQYSFSVALVSIAAYVVVSMLVRRRPIDFDRLFHRKQSLDPTPSEPDATSTRTPRWQRAVGITDEFTLGDKAIYALKYALFGWTFGAGFLMLVVLYFCGLMRTDDAWVRWWTICLVVNGIAGSLAVVWFLIGGFRDLYRLFVALSLIERDAKDDGRVTEHLGEN